MSNVIDAGNALLHFGNVKIMEAPRVVMLDDSLYSTQTHERDEKSLSARVCALDDNITIHTLQQIEPTDGSPRTPDSHVWERDAAAVIAWLDTYHPAPGSFGGVHLFGAGNAGVLASLIAIDRPDLVASLTLLDPLVYLPGADALFDSVLDLAALRGLDTNYWIIESQLMHSRKAMLATLIPRIRNEGVPRPVHLLFGWREASRAGAALLDIFDLFAARQFHTELHVGSEAGHIESAVCAFISSVDRTWGESR